MVNKPTTLKTIVVDVNNINENIEEIKNKVRTQINSAISEIKSNFPLGTDENWTKNVLSSDCADWLTKINLQGNPDMVVCDFTKVIDLLERKKSIVFYGNRVLAEIWIEWNKIWASKVEPDKNNGWENGKELEKNLQLILGWTSNGENTVTKKVINTKTKNGGKTYEITVQGCIESLLDKFLQYAKNNQPGGGSWKLKIDDYIDCEKIFDKKNNLNSLEKIKKAWEIIEKIVNAKKISDNTAEISNLLKELKNFQRSEKDIYQLLKKEIDESIVHLEGIRKDNFVTKIDDLLQEIADNDKNDASKLKDFIEKLEEWLKKPELEQETDQSKKKEINDNLVNLKTILNQLEKKISDNSGKEDKPLLVALSFVILVLTLVCLTFWSIKRWNNKSFED